MSTITIKFTAKLDQFDLYVDLKIPSTGVTILFGPSGCGKTTILRTLAGLNLFKDSEININNTIWQDKKHFTPAHKRKVGYVFQEASLFPHISVKENLIFAYKRCNSTLNVDEVVDLLGLERLIKAKPHHLSGGERQRVAIGRALLSQPDILLMDEPLSALDKQSKEEILPYLERLHKELKIPILYVTHDIREAERLGDHMIYIEKGRVIANAPIIDVINDPNLPFTKQPDARSLFEGRVKNFDETFGITTLAIGSENLYITRELTEIGSLQRVMIKASDVGISKTPLPDKVSILNTPSAKIIKLEENGPYKVNVYLNIGHENDGLMLLARITKKSSVDLNLQVGDTVYALIKGVALNGQHNQLS